MLATGSWAAGSLYARSAPRPESGAQMSGMQMLAGGVFLLLVALGSGEFARFTLADVSLRSALAFGYLTVFGSLVAFSAYAWLVKHTTATRASTYAYVNPVVAVLLGWALAGEPVSARTLLAGAVIVGAVVLISITQTEPSPTTASSEGKPARAAS